MQQLKQLYKKVSKQTQNNLQTIFDTIKFTSENIYNIVDKATKKRVDTYIEEYKEKGLLTGYFGVLANNIYKRTRVKNSEILELLIYGAYIEEQSKLQEQELNIFKEDLNHYYQEGQKEVNKKKTSVIPDAIFLALLDMPNATGLNWKQYIQTILQYNTQQMYKQTLINIQQQKQLEINSNEYQNIINNQIRQKININDNKISGATDIELIGLNNLAKIEGIKSIDNNAQVRLIAVIDGKETDMCHSLDGQLFYINKENVFDRYYGETQKELSVQRIKCFGLIVGLNLPPISHHFHWCRSTITYQIPNNNNSIELEQEKKFNMFDTKYEKDLKDKYNIKKLNVKHIDKKVLNKLLDNMEKVYKDFPQIKNKIKQIKEIEHNNGGMAIEPQKDGTYILEINKKYFQYENIAQREYIKTVKSNYHPKNSNYEDMIIHENGHMVLSEIIKGKYKNTNAIATDWNNNITSNEILKKAFNKSNISGRINKINSIKNISNYAIQKDASETIAEAFVDYYINKEKSQILSKSIIEVMKGMI